METKKSLRLFGWDLGTDIFSFLFLLGILIAIFTGKIQSIEFNFNLPITILAVGLLTTGKSIGTNITRYFKGII